MQRLTPAILMIALAGCGIEDSNPEDSSYTGEEAKSHLSLCDPEQLPASMTDLWVYDGGSFGGMMYYVSFQCETLEDCWAAVREFRAPDETEFANRIHTKFAVNQHGPSFYFKNLQHPHWDVSQIKNGVSYETNRSDEHMDFWAIDLDRLRVYFHHESGGFPDDPPSVRHSK